ncbi:MAG: acetyl-CoA carboxylase, biotin carboxyl carrier protein [Bacteroidetes bacterium B1(2017)]|nr:MAG: acetyl-CoA carboxylase, biotin carboxyl carrier protein [Bacteroidetes bacterium B1(2017)]
MELKEIKELIKLVSEAGVSEVEVERGDFKIAIKKQDDRTMVVHQSAPTYAPAPVHHVAAPVAAPVVTEKIEASATKTDSVAGNFITIKSPMIGTYYKSSSPDKPAFVQIGDEIKPGQVLCIVEAMKLFNEIEAEVSGRIVKILVDNASPIEYDQPLFLVEPK